MRRQSAADTTPRCPGFPEYMVRGFNVRRLIQRAGRNHHLAAAAMAWNRAAATAAKPLAEGFGREQLIAGDHILTRQPFKLGRLDNQIGCVTGARPFATTRAMAMDHSLERRGDFIAHRPAQATTV